MKGRVFFEKSFIYVVFWLFFIFVIGSVSSGAKELTPESDIVTLAVPSSGQTLYNAAPDYHDVAVAADGTFVATWIFRSESTSSDTEPEDAYILPVYAGRFHADGTPLTGTINVCAGFSPEDKLWNTNAGVACDDDGNFVVCWTRINREGNNDSQYTYRIYARLFDAEGQPLGDAFLIQDDIESTDVATSGVAMNGQGNFVVAWNETLDYYQPRTFFKRFDHNGSPLDPEPKNVNTRVENASRYAFSGSRPSVAINADGGFAVAWTTSHVLFYFAMAMLDNEIVFTNVRRFNKHGIPIGPARHVETVRYSKALSPDNRYISIASPVIAMNDAGKFAVSYYRYDYDAPGNPDYALSSYHTSGYRFYNRFGRAISPGKKTRIFMAPDSLVNAMDNNGNLVMAWFGRRDMETNSEARDALYLMQTPKGLASSRKIVTVMENKPYAPTPNGPETLSFPALDASDDGRFVIVWHDNENLLCRIYTIR